MPPQAGQQTTSHSRRCILVTFAVLGVLGWVLALSSPAVWVLRSETEHLRHGAPSSEPGYHEARVVFSASLYEDAVTVPNADGGPTTAMVGGRVPDDQVPDKHLTSVYRNSHKYGDLPQLPRRREPGGPEWNDSVAICACMLQENTTDVREWLLYHQWLGVDHVYLTENSNPAPEHLQEQLQDFIDSGFLTFRAIARPEFQVMFYKDCMEHHRHKHNWMAFIDLDEFIVLRNKEHTLKSYLNKFKHEAALVVHWIMVGPSHRDRRPQEGGALRAYTECNPRPQAIFKSIANTWFLANTAGSPHSFEYRNDKRAVNEKRKRVPLRYELPRACTDGTVAEPSKTTDCRPVPNVQIQDGASADDIVVYHYLTKSKEDFEMKVERGGGGNTHRTWNHFDVAQRRSRKGGICSEPAKLAEECCDPAQYVL